MKSNIIDLEGMIHYSTEKAVLFSVDGVRDNASWLPLSLIEVDDSSSPTIITLPENLAQEKGLI